MSIIAIWILRLLNHKCSVNLCASLNLAMILSLKGMRLFTLMGILFSNWVLLNSQSNTLENLLNSINNKYKNISCLAYTTKSTFRSVLDSIDKEDCSQVFISKYNFHDSICNFLVVKNEKLTNAFDGNYLFTVDTLKRNILAQKLESPFNLIKRGQIHWSIYGPIVFKRNLINTSKWNKDNSDYSIKDTLDYIDISLCNSFENTDLLFPNSPTIGTTELNIRISKKDTLIRNIEEKVHQTPNPQITRYTFSNYNLNLNNFEFDSILAMKMSELSAYKRDTIKRQLKKFIVETNKSFPDTVLICKSSGDPIKLRNFKSRYVLLDFWFRGCFPCIKASQIANKLYTNFLNQNDLKIIGINILDNSIYKFQDYIARYDLKYEQYYCKNYEYRDILTGYGCPLIILYDTKERKILYYTEGVGDKTESELTELIAKF